MFFSAFISVPTWLIVSFVIVALLLLLCIVCVVRKICSKRRTKGKEAKKGMKGGIDIKGVSMIGQSSKVRNATKMHAIVTILIFYQVTMGAWEGDGRGY